MSGALRVELALGQHAQGRFDDRKTVLDGGDRDRPARRLRRRMGMIGGRSGRRQTDERVPVGNGVGPDAIGVEHFDQGFAATRRIGGQQHATGVGDQERLERAGRLAFLSQRQVGRRGQVERVGLWVSGVAVGAQLDSRQAVEPLAQRLR